MHPSLVNLNFRTLFNRRQMKVKLSLESLRNTTILLVIPMRATTCRDIYGHLFSGMREGELVRLLYTYTFLWI